MHFFAIATVLHTLVVAVIAFFVLFAASKADGFVRLLGNVLGWIILAIGLLAFVAGIVHVVTGKGPGMGMEHGDHWMMMYRDHDHDGPPPGAMTVPAQPTPPASPAPATPPKGK